MAIHKSVVSWTKKVSNLTPSLFEIENLNNSCNNVPRGMKICDD